MKSWWKRAALASVAALVLLAVALAQEAPVRLELRSGERIEGDLVEFGEHVYRVRSGGSVREVKESDVARLDFLPAAVAAGTSACPMCGMPALPGMGQRCAADGTPLVRGDLVLLHEAISVLARGKPERGLENPFAKLVLADGSIDAAALERLVADYKVAARANHFAAWKGALPLSETSSRRVEYASALGALHTITTAQQIFREGDKEQDGNLDYGMLSELSNVTLVDSILGKGTKQGYLFNASYSLTTSEFLWYATAVPKEPRPGDLSFFTNQGGRIYVGLELPPINKNTCEVPRGLAPVDEEELLHPRVVGGARPLREANDVLPLAGELPPALALLTIERSDAEVIAAERAKLEGKIASSATDPEATAALRDQMLSREGHVELVAAQFAEGNSGLVNVSVGRYESVEACARSALARARTEDRSRRVLMHAGLAHRETMLVAGPFWVVVELDRGSAPAFATVVGLLTRRLEQAFPGDVRTVRDWLESALQPSDLAAPFARLPSGLISVEPLERSPVDEEKAKFGFVNAAEARALYRSLAGSVTVSLYGHPAEKDKPRAPLGGPTPEQLRNFRDVWLSETRAVTLQVEGRVPEEAIQWLESYLESVIKSAADTKDARRIETGWRPGAVLAPLNVVREIVTSRQVERYDEALRLLASIPEGTSESADAESFREWIEADRDVRVAKVDYDNGDFARARGRLAAVLRSSQSFGPEAKASVTRRLEAWGKVAAKLDELRARPHDESSRATAEEILALEPNVGNAFHKAAQTWLDELDAARSPSPKPREGKSPPRPGDK